MQITMFLDIYYTKKLGLGYFMQIKDILFICFVVTISGVVVYFITFISISNMLNL